MMEELCYSALDLAAIISGMGLGCRAKADFLERVWEGERPFLQKMYRENKRQLILDVNYWLTYLSDKPLMQSFQLSKRMLWPWGMNFPLTLMWETALASTSSSKTPGFGYSMAAEKITCG